MGSGFVAEPYHGDPHKTLLSYLAHVSSLEGIQNGAGVCVCGGGGVGGWG